MTFYWDFRAIFWKKNYVFFVAIKYKKKQPDTSFGLLISIPIANFFPDSYKRFMRVKFDFSDVPVSFLFKRKNAPHLPLLKIKLVIRLADFSVITSISSLVQVSFG